LAAIRTCFALLGAPTNPTAAGDSEAPSIRTPSSARDEERTSALGSFFMRLPLGSLAVGPPECRVLLRRWPQFPSLRVLRDRSRWELPPTKQLLGRPRDWSFRLPRAGNPPQSTPP